MRENSFFVNDNGSLNVIKISMQLLKNDLGDNNLITLSTCSLLNCS
jgi:hypothetical protein